MTSPDQLGQLRTPAPRAEFLDWLRRSAAPGEGGFRRAAASTTIASIAGVGQWGGVAWLVSEAYGDPAPSKVAVAAGGLMAATVVRAIATHLSRTCADRGARAVTRELRERSLGRVLPEPGQMTPPPAEIAAQAVVDLTERVGTYHARARPARLAAAPSCAAILLAVAVVHWPVALLLLLATPVLPVNLRLAGLSAEAANRGQLDAVRRLSAQLLDRFRGMRTLHRLGAVEREEAVVRASCDALNQATTVVLRRAFVAAGVLDVVVTFAIAISATYVGLTLLGYLHLPAVPRLGFTSGLFVLLMAPAYFGPLREVQSGYHERDGALAAATTLMPLTSGPDADRAHPRPPLRAAPSVELDDVTVAHPPIDRVILADVSIRLPAGRHVVLSAPSGAGKSTLLGIVAGLRVPTSGRVLLRGPHEPAKESRTVSAPQPGQASWLGQRTVLLAGSLADNIRIGAPAASQHDVARSASAAGLDELLARLPDGLDTLVGDGGWGISAGEARRVALARALLRDAPLWLLDEPTAHLDAATEAELINRLEEATRGRTVLIATHSAELTRRACTVWKLDRGALLEESPGTG